MHVLIPVFSESDTKPLDQSEQVVQESDGWRSDKSRPWYLSWGTDCWGILTNNFIIIINIIIIIIVLLYYYVTIPKTSLWYEIFNQIDKFYNLNNFDQDAGNKWSFMWNRL